MVFIKLPIADSVAIEVVSKVRICDLKEDLNAEGAEVSQRRAEKCLILRTSAKNSARSAFRK
jgi:hypothetical protein